MMRADSPLFFSHLKKKRMDIATALRSLNNDNLEVSSIVAERLRNPVTLENQLRRWVTVALGDNRDAHAFVTPRRLGAALLHDDLAHNLHELGEHARRHADLVAYRRQSANAASAGMKIDALHPTTFGRDTERQRRQREASNLSSTGTIWANTSSVEARPDLRRTVTFKTTFSDER